MSTIKIPGEQCKPGDKVLYKEFTVEIDRVEQKGNRTWLIGKVISEGDHFGKTSTQELYKGQIKVNKII